MSIKKTAKRLFAAIVALVLSVAMVTPAFAADEKGTITIKNAVEGQTYTIYKIADLESYASDCSAYAYKVTKESDWYEFLSSSKYVNVDEDGYVTWNLNEDQDQPAASDVASFAKEALAYAKSNSISNDGQTEATTATVTFSDLDLGWYLVDTSLGSLCSLDTTDTTAEIDEKNTAPTIDKEVVGSTGNEPSVGDSVNFKITVTAQKGAQNYVVHDTMSDGLTFNNDVAVTVNGNTLTNPSDYTVTTDTDEGHNCTFEVIFTESYLNSITAETEIEITYSATINAEAVKNTNPETNEAILDYGDNSSTSSTTETETYVYYFDLVKDDTSNKLIAGAEFSLYESKTGGTAIQFVVDNGTYRVATVEEIADTQTPTTDTISVDNGIVRISGLGKGTYYLEETKAPDGYNKLTSREVVSVNSNADAIVKDTNDSSSTDAGDTYVSGGVEVENKSGSLLPSTGGTGTTTLYVVGGALVVAAGVALVVRRRMSSQA